MEKLIKFAFIISVFGLLMGCGQSKSSALEGKVVDGKGQPMANVKIIAKQVEPIKGYEKLETITGGDGKFTFKGLFPNSAYEVFPYWENQISSVRLKVQSAPEGLTKMLPAPINIRFTKAKDNVITDSATGLEWYVGPERRTSWRQAKAWTEGLSAAGGGWRMPTIPELRGIYQNGAGRGNMDPMFQTTGTCVWSGQVKSQFGTVAHIFFFDDGSENWNPLDVSSNLSRAFAVRSHR
jgi:hypothetical protein